AGKQKYYRWIQAKLVGRNPVNSPALPQIGPDAVKIGKPDGHYLNFRHLNFRRAGDIRARSTRNRGIADECHDSLRQGRIKRD
ncbi:hypothetical protein, partial [Bradyrhizobium sp.]|uniref:hypothetical protein n=1 Tax=Bradyrhizobium sp. TaxID=376 RepID=UPI0025C5E45B